jgi:hypothetical protein
MMRKAFLILITLVTAVSLVACGNKDSSIDVKDLNDSVAEVWLPDFVPNDEVIDTFYDYGQMYFNNTYENFVYTEFQYSGLYEGLDQIDGDMIIIFSADKLGTAISTTNLLVSVYTKSDRNINYYVKDGGEKTESTPIALTSQRYSTFIETMKSYLSNLGVTSGYIEITEYPLDGYWMVYHSPAKGKTHDITMKIDSNTLELLEYN